jgi:signal transduction histidine kinase
LQVESDRTLLSGLLGNLFSNVAAYTPPGGEVALRAEETTANSGAGRAVRLRLTNSNADLVPDDIQHVAEPFWRKDAARPDGSHAGLGLSLVKAYAAALGARATFDLPATGLFRASITLPAASVSDELAGETPRPAAMSKRSGVESTT